jgi:Family of unknown function (DUF6508)
LSFDVLHSEQLAKLSLALVRQDRFVEGALAKAYDDKILLAPITRVDLITTRFPHLPGRWRGTLGGMAQCALQ